MKKHLTEEEYFIEWFNNKEWLSPNEVLESDYKNTIMGTYIFKSSYAQYILKFTVEEFVNSFRFKWMGRLIIKFTKIRFN